MKVEEDEMSFWALFELKYVGSFVGLSGIQLNSLRWAEKLVNEWALAGFGLYLELRCYS